MEEAPALQGEGLAVALGIGQRAHVLARLTRRARRAERAAALGDRAIEQALGQRRGAQHADGNAAGRLAEDRDLVRISAKRGDILS